VDGNEYTEDTLNDFPRKDISDQFKEDDYKILVVANEFLTGFDEPLLASIFSAVARFPYAIPYLEISIGRLSPVKRVETLVKIGG